MKKLFVIFLVLVLASGCDNKKTLSCTSTTTNNGIVTKTSYDVDYVGDELRYVTITYDYMTTKDNNDVDGVDSDTDGLSEDNDNSRMATDADDVVDGVVGDAIDTTVDGVRDTILDIAGIKNNYENQFSNYDNMEGFSYDVDIDNDTEYRIIYEIDMQKISDNDLASFNIGRDFSTFQTDYEDLGYTCK